MYGFGDDETPLPETIDLVEVRCFTCYVAVLS